jgi:HlyD family secretion protein
MKIPLMPWCSAAALMFAVGATLAMKPEQERMETPLPPVRAEYRDAVAGTGVVEPAGEMHYLRPARSGRVARVLVEPGQRVVQGEMLVELETAMLQAQLTRARADVTVRLAAVDVAEASRKKAEYRRAEAGSYRESAEALADARAMSREELTRRRSASAVAEVEEQEAVAQWASAKAALDVARAEERVMEAVLEEAIIRAPVAGTMLKVGVRAGDFMEAREGRGELILGGGEELRLRVEVDQEEAGRWSAGGAATGVVRGQPGRRVPLEFVRVEPMMSAKRNLGGAGDERVDTRVLQVLYRVAPAEFELRVGEQMEVFVEVKGRETLRQ